MTAKRDDLYGLSRLLKIGKAVEHRIDSTDPASPDAVLDLPPGSAAVHIPHRQSPTVQRFERLQVITGGSFDTDIDGQPATAKGKDGHAASFSLIAYDASESTLSATSTTHDLDRRLDGHCRRNASSLVVMDKTHRGPWCETDRGTKGTVTSGSPPVVA